MADDDVLEAMDEVVKEEDSIELKEQKTNSRQRLQRHDSLDMESSLFPGHDSKVDLPPQACSIFFFPTNFHDLKLL